jgi:hypothetical protein
MQRLRKDVWTTYAEWGFSQPYGDNRKADGCITLHQVRRKSWGKAWQWQERRVNVNCCEKSASEPWDISDNEGMRVWELAERYARDPDYQMRS